MGGVARANPAMRPPRSLALPLSMGLFDQTLPEPTLATSTILQNTRTDAASDHARTDTRNVRVGGAYENVSEYVRDLI